MLGLRKGDALIIVDYQNDFLPGGSLPVPEANEIVGVLNRMVLLFQQEALPLFATRDWHPPDHISFKAQGGPWPPHCVAGSGGASFAPELNLSRDTKIISKGTRREAEAYSGFEGTNLEQMLKDLEIERIFVGGVATDYCVLNTVKDAAARGFRVVLLQDAVRGVNAAPDDSDRAIAFMKSIGVQLIQSRDLVE
jgi:nicotinamidase/pyrazinamidase